MASRPQRGEERPAEPGGLTIDTSDEHEFTPGECHQIASLANKIGRACNGKFADVVGAALQTIVADVTMQCAETEVDLHEGVDAFCNDGKAFISERLAAKRAH